MTTIDGPGSITLLPSKVADTNAISKSTTDFGDMLSSMIDKVNETQITGDQAVTKLQSGDAGHPS